MQYLIIIQDPNTGEKSAYYTNWFSLENDYNANYKMIVIDLINDVVLFDGKTLQKIQEDHL
jgi:hypothetical protein